MIPRLSLTHSMFLLIACVGVVIWNVSDTYQSAALHDIFYVKLKKQFQEEATEQRTRFDRYVKAFYPAVRTYASQTNMRDYLDQTSWSANDKIHVIDHKRTPRWLPKLSMMRRFIMPRYALLLDSDNNLREIYHHRNPMLSDNLLHLSEDLLDNSYKQSYMTEIENKLYILSSSFIGEEDESPRLLILSPIDEEFLIDSQGVVGNKNIALLDPESSKILVSSDQKNIPKGATIEELKDKFLSSVAGHLGSGIVQFGSFVSTKDVEEQSSAILSKDRQIRAITAFFYIFSFALVMYWVTSRIQQLTRRIVEFSTTMDIPQPKFKTHDELLELEKRFELMANAVRSETQALEYQALHDPLTVLPNRKLLHNKIQIEFLGNEFKATTFILMLTDLDQFKEINDTLGHHIGDKVLIKAGARLKNLLRKNDTVSRLGGDEFGILLPNTTIKNASFIAEKIVSSFISPFIIEGQSLNVGISVGVVEFPLHGQDQTVLMQRADVAMYHAKQHRLGYSIYKEEEDTNTLSRLSLMADFRDALENEKLFLYYQPKINIKTRTIISIEALLRWKHPTHGYISPLEFIPLAEQTGLILPLTLWVLKKATTQCKHWQNLGYNVSIAINISAYCLQFTDFTDTINEILKKINLSPESCILEITETIFMKDSDRAGIILNKLNDRGFELSIDDFGTGYSSLGYLQRLPVKELKIDKSFVMEMMVNKNDAAIVKAIIELAHTMGMRVVAEGVETVSVLDHLNEIGCDIAQGYLMAKPMPPDQLICLFKKTNLVFSSNEFDDG